MQCSIVQLLAEDLSRNYRTIKALIKLLEQYPNANANGDMNVVEGEIELSMKKALSDTPWRIARDYCTFSHNTLQRAADLP